MTYKQLEKANRILEQVKLLDGEIIEIDRIAMMIANGEVKIELNLSVTDLSKQKEEANKVEFDEDGSLSSTRGLSFYMRSWSPFSISIDEQSEKKEKKHEQKYWQSIQENEALQILGVLLYAKQSKRQDLLQKLDAMGIANSKTNL